MGLLDILNGMQNGPRGQRQPTSVDSSAGKGGGMSPIMIALLGLLAYKAVKGGGSQPAAPGGTGRPTALPPGGTVTAGNPGGGIGDILGGLLGGKPMGAPATNAPGGTVTAGNPAGSIGDILGGLLGGKPTNAPATKAPGAKPGNSLQDLLPGGLGGLLGGAAAGTVLSGGLSKLIKELQDSGHGRVAQSWVGSGENHEIAPHDLADALGGDTIDALSQQTGLQRDDLLAGLSQHLPDLIDQLTPHGRLPSEDEAHRMV